MRHSRVTAGSWLLLCVVASCVLNPQPTDPVRSDEDYTGSSATGGGATTNVPDAAAPSAEEGGITGVGGSSATGGSGASWAGEPIVVQADSGWVDEESNSLGVQGSWYAVGSEGTEDLSPDRGAPLANAGDGVLCVAGVAAQVVDGDTVTYFGAGLGFDLCASDVDDTPPETRYTLGECPYNADLASQLVGINFELTGELVPAEIRVVFVEAGREESTYVLATEGDNVALLSAASVAHDASAAAIDPAAVESVYFLVPGSEAGPTEFDFCIADVNLLFQTAAGSGGAAGEGGSAGGS